MGDGTCSWFGRPPTTAPVVGTAQRAKKCYRLGMHSNRHLVGILMEMGGMWARIKVKNVGIKHIQQSTMAEGSNGRQWGGGTDGGR